MANRKISDLTALTAPASGDYLPIVDISEAAAADKNKRITIEELFRGVPLGTAAAPAIAIEGDENTGIYSPGADQLAISTGGTGRLFVDTSGNIGVGATPLSGHQLTVNAASLARIALQTGTLGQTSSDGFALEMDSSGVYFTNRENIPSIFYTNNQERLRITSAGRVGIGTGSPSQVLTAVGNIKIAGAQAGNVANLCLTRTDRSWTINNETDLRFRTGAGDTDSPATATVVFTGAGNVGIGTTSPPEKLAVVGNTTTGATSGAGYGWQHSNGTGLQVNGDFGTSRPTLALWHLYGSNSDAGQIVFKGLSSGGNTINNASIYAVQTGTTAGSGSGELVFTTGTSLSERARIDSSGRLLVGTSTSTNNIRLDQKLAVVTTGASTFGGINLTSYCGTLFTAGPLLDFQRSNGTTDGSFVKVENGDRLGGIVFRGADGAGFVDGATIAAIADGGTGSNDLPTRLVFSTTADGAATPTERMRIDSTGLVTLAGPGIKFPATQVASADPNTLDDYEEGTFTPTIVGTTTPGTGTYSFQNGNYTKIGNFVFARLQVVWSAHTGTGNMRISGLPFTISQTSVGTPFPQNVSLTAGNILYLYLEGGGTQIQLYQGPTGGGAGSTVPIDTDGDLIVTCTYRV